MGEVVKYKDGEYDGWGTFECSVCGKSTFLQYDSYEKPSNGQGINYKGKFYVLCDRCCGKCMRKGMKKYLKDAHDYKETPQEQDNPADKVFGDIPNEYKGIAGLLPAIGVFCAIGLALKKMDKVKKK